MLVFFVFFLFLGIFFYLLSFKLSLILSTEKELYTFEAQKRDFADLIELAEEDAKKRKLFKKGCDAVEIANFETL